MKADQQNPVVRTEQQDTHRGSFAHAASLTDSELARLWPELAYRPVYASVCKAAVLTGLRFGELAALEWGDVDLLNRELHVRQTYTSGIGVGTPKSGEADDQTAPKLVVASMAIMVSGMLGR